MSNTILLVEDNEKFRRLTKRMLEKHGFKVIEAATGQQAEEKIGQGKIEVVLLDILLPDTTGLKLLEKWSLEYSNTSFIMCTAYGDIEDAVKAMKMGAFDYLTKPLKAEELKVVIDRALEIKTLKEENKQLKKVIHKRYNLHGMIGKSEKMQEVFELVERIASQDITILLEGESGTGKSRCAHAIHLESSRKNMPFVKVNCASIPSNLLESELFGYEKGAFTGATEAREGKFSAANKGTLFLDEIGEISIDLQAKLLQFTQDKTYMPLGSTRELTSDVRIIAATNRNLWEMVQAGEFREDLYYRLNIIGVKLPALRERVEDIPDMINVFLGECSKEHNRGYTITKELLKKLSEYPWPGNIRELENAIARATVLSPKGELRLKDFPEEVRNYFKADILAGDVDDDVNGEDEINFEDDFSLPEHLEQVEQKAIEKALQDAGGNQAKAAESLGISRQSLLYKLKKYGI